MSESQATITADGPFGSIAEERAASKTSKHHRVYTAICLVALGIALLAFVGWVIDSRLLRAWVPMAISMNPLTAICFAALAAVLARSKPGAPPLADWKVAATLLVVIGAIQLAGTYLNTGFRLDHGLFSGRLAVNEPVPNRMAPNTAFALLATGGAMLLLTGSERRVRIAQVILATNFLGVLFAVMGYAYHVDGLYRLGEHPPMALNTALLFLAVTGALAWHVANRGLFAPFAAETIGGQIARRFLPFLLFVPPILGWLRVWGEKQGFFDAPTGSAIMSLIWIVALLAVVLLTARSMNVADSKRLAAEKALERRAEELQAAQRELESFSYSVSHDLRAPLRHISGFIGLLESSSTVLDAKAKRYIGIINDSAVQMGRLIDDLLMFSRLGRAELLDGELDLEELVSEAIGTVESLEKDRQIVWQRTALPKIKGDRSMLRQVFLNLLQNAAKYTRQAAEPKVEISSVADPTGGLIVAIGDNGVGFDMKYADKLFGVFQRLHRPEDFEGTGIGLANVRRVIARHGGKTWAEAKVNEGATFYLSLPKERVLG